MTERADLSVPPAPLCTVCGRPCCLCMILASHPCTVPPELCEHSYDADEIDVWQAECAARMRAWRRANTGRWCVMVEANGGSWGFTGPRRLVVELGPVLPYALRRRLADETEACPLCGDELIDEDDDSSPCTWRVCARLEAEPDAGHLELAW
jgi:hypothetical protein